MIIITQLFPLQTIIRVFEFIVRFNIFIKNQRYIELNILYKYILKIRRAYQKLIIYIISIVESFRNNDKKKKKNNFKNENVFKKKFDATRFDLKSKMKKI